MEYLEPKKRFQRTKIQREADLIVVADLYRRNWSMRQIAEQICARRDYKIGYVTIHKDVELIISRWRKQQATYIENFVLLQIEQIGELKRELWNEYLRSKTSLKRFKEKRKGVLTKEDLIDLEMDAIFDTITSDQIRNKRPNPAGSIEIHFTDLSNAKALEVDQTIEEHERLGDPKYLELIARLMEQESRLLGFYNTDNITPTASVIIVTTPATKNLNEYKPLDYEKDGE